MSLIITESQILIEICYVHRTHMLQKISSWLDSRPELKMERRSCEAEILEPDEIAELESFVEQFMEKNRNGRIVNLKIRPFHLYLVSIPLAYKVGNMEPLFSTLHADNVIVRFFSISVAFFVG